MTGTPSTGGSTVSHLPTSHAIRSKGFDAEVCWALARGGDSHKGEDKTITNENSLNGFRVDINRNHLLEFIDGPWGSSWNQFVGKFGHPTTATNGLRESQFLGRWRPQKGLHDFARQYRTWQGINLSVSASGSASSLSK